jgi:ABC-2 type transport system ATP-binding protein
VAERLGPSGTGAALLALEGVSKRWGELQVLECADLALPAGARVWLGGRNGAGKTTLLRIAAGLIAPDSGAVWLDGLSPERHRREFQRRLGFLSAGNSGLYARLSVHDNLRFGAGIALLDRRRRRPAIEAALARFELEELASRRVDRLSMGQRQRVRLALALLHAPSVLLLDEPQTSLDDEALGLLARTLDAHAEGGGATLICAPAREHLGSLPVDTAHVLEAGRLRPA